MTTLLDANVLVALTSPDHVHNAAATHWFSLLNGPFATCTVTQLALVRVLIGAGAPTGVAVTALGTIQGHQRHEFWPDEASIEPSTMRSVVGHRQVTDVYLADLARRQRGRIATFDRGLHASHPGVAELVPT